MGRLQKIHRVFCSSSTASLKSKYLQKIPNSLIIEFHLQSKEVESWRAAMATDVRLWSPLQPAWGMHRAAALTYESLKFKTSPKSPMNDWEGHKGKGSCWLTPPNRPGNECPLGVW